MNLMKIFISILLSIVDLRIEYKKANIVMKIFIVTKVMAEKKELF